MGNIMGGLAIIVCIGLFLLVQTIRAFLWHYTAGGGKAKAAAEYQRLLREIPDSPLVSGKSEQEFSLDYIKKNGPSFWLYLILLLCFPFLYIALIGGGFYATMM